MLMYSFYHSISLALVARSCFWAGVTLLCRWGVPLPASARVRYLTVGTAGDSWLSKGIVVNCGVAAGCAQGNHAARHLGNIPRLQCVRQNAVRGRRGAATASAERGGGKSWSPNTTEPHTWWLSLLERKYTFLTRRDLGLDVSGAARHTRCAMENMKMGRRTRRCAKFGRWTRTAQYQNLDDRCLGAEGFRHGRSSSLTDVGPPSESEGGSRSELWWTRQKSDYSMLPLAPQRPPCNHDSQPARLAR